MTQHLYLWYIASCFLKNKQAFGNRKGGLSHGTDARVFGELWNGKDFRPVTRGPYAHCPGPPPSLPALADSAKAFRDALANPVGMPPLEKLVKKGAKVTIGIQDGRSTHYSPEDEDLRILGLPILMGLLEQYGVDPADIRIIVANALHRKWTRKELTHILGPRLPYTLGGRLSCLDATDPEQFIPLGMTRRGMEVMVHRSVVESDLFIFLSAPQGFLPGGGSRSWWA